MHSNFCIVDFNVISECASSDFVELELPSLARLLALSGIFDGKKPNLTGVDSYMSVTITYIFKKTQCIPKKEQDKGESINFKKSFPKIPLM